MERHRLLDGLHLALRLVRRVQQDFGLTRQAVADVVHMAVGGLARAVQLFCPLPEVLGERGEPR